MLVAMWLTIANLLALLGCEQAVELMIDTGAYQLNFRHDSGARVRQYLRLDLVELRRQREFDQSLPGVLQFLLAGAQIRCVGMHDLEHLVALFLGERDVTQEGLHWFVAAAQHRPWWRIAVRMHLHWWHGEAGGRNQCEAEAGKQVVRIVGHAKAPFMFWVTVASLARRAVKRRQQRVNFGKGHARAGCKVPLRHIIDKPIYRVREGTMAKVLLVDDDVDLSAMLKEYLEYEGFEVNAVHDGESGVCRSLDGTYDIVVLDVMMPGISGIEALRRIRTGSRVPVLMLTARGDDVDRVIGLELGADDYVSKPCTPRELVARLRAILRRSGQVAEPAETSTVVAGRLRIWPDKRRAEWDGQPIELTSTEFNLIEALAKHVGNVVSKATLSERGLGRPLSRYDRSIDVHVSNLRQKLGSLPDGRSWIQTVRGIGYQLIRE
jgi:two-component system, OmpR family, response regulator